MMKLFHTMMFFIMCSTLAGAAPSSLIDSPPAIIPRPLKLDSPLLSGRSVHGYLIGEGVSVKKGTEWPLVERIFHDSGIRTIVSDSSDLIFRTDGSLPKEGTSLR